MLPDNCYIEHNNHLRSQLLPHAQLNPQSPTQPPNPADQTTILQEGHIPQTSIDLENFVQANSIGNPYLERRIKDLEHSLEKYSFRFYIYWLYVFIGLSFAFLGYVFYFTVENWHMFALFGILGVVNIVQCSLAILGIKKKHYTTANTAAGLMIVYMLAIIVLIMFLDRSHIASKLRLLRAQECACAALFLMVVTIPDAWKARNILEEILDIKDRIHYQNLERLGMLDTYYSYARTSY